VIRSQPGIRQRCRPHRVQAIRQWHQVTGRWHQDEFSHASVGAQPAATTGCGCRQRLLAVVLHAEQAPRARAAAPGAIDRDWLANVQPTRAGAELVHPARVLMAQRERRSPGQLPGGEVTHQVQVGVAGTGPADAHHDLAGARLGVRHLDQDRIGLPLEQPESSH
jgi:hypothetical protein